VGKLASDVFDPKAFLSKVGTGKTIVEFEKNQQIFGQGDVADAVFISKRVASNSLSYPSTVRKRSSGF